jgi:hypothetical protein
MINSKQIISDFIKVAELVNINISQSDIALECLQKPHTKPKFLPKGKMAVYVFMWNDFCLKVGKVGPNSQPRYTSHHYNSKSSNSNLAQSIIRDGVRFALPLLKPNNVGVWIEQETDRFNFLIDKSFGIHLLSLMEIFIQCKLRPKFEGYVTQQSY